MSRHDLTDREFNAIRHLLPGQNANRRGRPWSNHRTVINGILWILHTGSPWRDLPAEFGKWKTVYGRFRRWINEDIWDRIFSHLLHRLDSLGKIERSLWCVDGTVIRAHRCASGMIPQSEENDELNALGRSRGGYSTKLHVMTDANGILLAVTATGGQKHESTEFECLLGNCELSLHRHSKRPEALAGDKGYSSTAIREFIRKLSISDVIPSRSNESADVDFDRETYRRRNIIERAIGWLKESRRIATRYDKLTSSYLTFVQLAAMRKLIKAI
jgi:transposase